MDISENLPFFENEESEISINSVLIQNDFTDLLKNFEEIEILKVDFKEEKYEIFFRYRDKTYELDEIFKKDQDIGYNLLKKIIFQNLN